MIRKIFQGVPHKGQEVLEVLWVPILYWSQVLVMEKVIPGVSQGGTFGYDVEGRLWGPIAEATSLRGVRLGV